MLRDLYEARSPAPPGGHFYVTLRFVLVNTYAKYLVFVLSLMVGETEGFDVNGASKDGKNGEDESIDYSN